MWDMNYPQIMSSAPFASKSGGHVPSFYGSAGHGNEVECRIYGGWERSGPIILSVCGIKFMAFWDDVRDPRIVFFTHPP